jgi:hypothetical protein
MNPKKDLIILIIQSIQIDSVAEKPVKADYHRNRDNVLSTQAKA